jgi:hypothetical protein
MTQFDPSVLQDIQGPDVTGSMAKGFALKDLVNNTELNTLRGTVEKTDMQRKEKARSLLSQGGDSTDQEVATKAAKLREAGLGPEAMDYMQHAQSVRTGAYKQENERLQNAAEQTGQLNQMLMSIKTQADSVTDPQTKQATVKAQLPLLLQSVKDSKSFDPATKQMVIQKIQQEIESPDPYGSLSAAVSQTKESMDRAKKELDMRNVQSEIAQRGVEEQHQKVEEQQGQQRTNIEGAKLGIEQQKLKLAQGNQSLDAMYASFGEAGIQIPGRSRQTQDAAMRGLLAKYPDKQPDEIAQGVKNGQISMVGLKTEAGALGRREAAILPVEKSITRPGGFLEQAESAVNAVNFPKLKAAGKFESWGKEQESDPALSRYKAAVAELRAEYSIVLSKGGQVTDAARQEAEKVIPDLITKGQFTSIKQVVLQGIESSKAGIEESLSAVSGQATAPPQATTPVAPFSDADKEKRYQEWKRAHPHG